MFNQDKPLRWGIVGAGYISSDFVIALGILQNHHKVLSIASKNLGRAKEFAIKHGIDVPVGSYEELAKNKDIDIVYIGNLNNEHYSVCQMMIGHGKNILCEKPMCLNAKQTETLIKLSKIKNVFLMEAIWSRCFPVYDELVKSIESGIIGDVKQVNISFGFVLNTVDRLKKNELGGGTILDIGIYTLQLAQLIFRKEKLLGVHAFGELNKEKVDESAVMILKYTNKKQAVLTTHSHIIMSNRADIMGTKGCINIPMFWCPTEIIINGNTKSFPLPKPSVETHFHNSIGLTYEAEEVRMCLNQELKESPLVPHTEMKELAKIRDEARKQIGVVYDAD